VPEVRNGPRAGQLQSRRAGGAHEDIILRKVPASVIPSVNETFNASDGWLAMGATTKTRRDEIA
jgi:hypothetical protein